MSNLIKAQQINYAENIRKIDMNERAERFQQAFVDKYIADNIVLKQIDFEEVSRKLEDERVLMPEDVNFTPGIAGETVYVSEQPENEAPAENENEAVGLEARLREKRRELEEIKTQIKEVQEEAARIIDNANAEAKEIVDNAVSEAELKREEVFEAAREEGYNAGASAAHEEVEAARAELENLRTQYKEDYEKQVEELEPAFVEIMINYVRKLTGIYAEDKKDIILHLIDNAMKDKKGIDNFIIRVSEADFAMASYSKDSMRGYLSDGATIEVIADKVLSKNQCLIETESRIFDCSLDSQMLSLIEDIRMLAEKD